MNPQETDMRDLVSVHVAGNLPIRSRALPFADRVEIRLGNAFPVALLVDRAAIDRLLDAIVSSRVALETATQRTEEE